MVCTLRFFSSKCSLLHNSNVFGCCIIHILYTGCVKIKINNSGAKRLRELHYGGDVIGRRSPCRYVTAAQLSFS